MEAVSDEMEVTAGLIQKLVDKNATRKPLSAMVWKSARRFERKQRAGFGDFRISCPLFLCMEIKYIFLWKFVKN